MTSPLLPTYVEPAPEGAGDPDPASAALVFRVGVADTDYLQHGQLHVLMRLLSSAVVTCPCSGAPWSARSAARWR